MGDKQKSLSRGFGFPAPSGAMREATLTKVIAAPLAAELIRRRVTHPLAVDRQWFLLSPHSLRRGDRTGRCSLWPPDVLSAWGVGEPCPPGRSFSALIFFGRPDAGSWRKANISLALPRRTALSSAIVPCDTIKGENLLPREFCMRRPCRNDPQRHPAIPGLILLANARAENSSVPLQ